MVYILYHLRERGLLDEGFMHCVDSTELPVDRQQLLATLTIKGKKIRIYDDIDCDCEARRKKRDKSVYVVGYPQGPGGLRIMDQSMRTSKSKRPHNELPRGKPRGI